MWERLESPQGNFARAGQAISRQGEPGGEYVVVEVKMEVAEAAKPRAGHSAWRARDRVA